MLMIMMMMMMMMMVTQYIPTSQIPTRWESDIIMKGGNMTESDSHQAHIYLVGICIYTNLYMYKSVYIQICIYTNIDNSTMERIPINANTATIDLMTG